MLRHISVSILFVLIALLGATACSTLNVARASKPVVIINAPPSGSQFSEGDNVVVQSTATDSTGIVRVELTVDGAIVKIDTPPPGQVQPSINVAQVWKAIPGNHTLIVSAVNSNGAVSNPVGISVSVSPATAPVPSSTPTLPSFVPTSTPIPSATNTDVPATIAATPCSKPQIASFTINPTEIKRGDTATLNWGAVTNANSAVIDNGIGGVPAPGSRQVRPDKNTTYTLTGSGCGGTITTQVTVNVFPLDTPAQGIPQGKDSQRNPYGLDWDQRSNYLYGIDIETDRNGSFQPLETKENLNDNHYDVKNLPGGKYRLRFRTWLIDRNTHQRVSLKSPWSVICFNYNDNETCR